MNFRVAMLGLLLGIAGERAIADMRLDSDTLSRLSLLRAEREANVFFFWFSEFKVEKNADTFRSADDVGIMAARKIVRSAYDDTVSHDVSSFYTAKSSRYKLTANITGLTPGEIFSVGYDSGLNAEKISIKNAVYVGYTNSFVLSKNSLFNFSAGKWFGGKVKESPCLDDYSREFWCQNLTAWNDYQPSYPKSDKFITFKITNAF